jgi:hypothetical protein
MKERPILMRGPLVVATLEDRKWKTRRVITPQPPRQLFRVDQNDFNAWVLASRDNPDEPDWSFSIRCPYGSVGDRLWVRETWAQHPDEAGIIWRATDPGWDDNDYGIKWKPSIFMPRWASRLTLEITDIQVERVQQITPADKEAEGLNESQGYGPAAFESLWNEINAKRGYSWGENPWVWVISYKRVPQ